MAMRGAAGIWKASEPPEAQGREEPFEAFVPPRIAGVYVLPRPPKLKIRSQPPPAPEPAEE
jgi:hypothetical protein